MPDAVPRDQLLRELAVAFEHLIATAIEASRRGATGADGAWGPREFVAHLAGWEVMASVRVPHVVAGMAPLDFDDDARDAAMSDAVNATIVTMIGDQSLETLCVILRQAYQRDIAMLNGLDERHLQPGEYVYERTLGVIEHCQEHVDDIQALPQTAR